MITEVRSFLGIGWTFCRHVCVCACVYAGEKQEFDLMIRAVVLLEGN